MVSDIWTISIILLLTQFIVELLLHLIEGADELFNTNYYAMAGLNKRITTVGAHTSRDQESFPNRKQHEAQENDRKLQV